MHLQRVVAAPEVLYGRLTIRKAGHTAEGDCRVREENIKDKNQENGEDSYMCSPFFALMRERDGLLAVETLACLRDTESLLDPKKD